MVVEDLELGTEKGKNRLEAKKVKVVSWSTYMPATKTGTDLKNKIVLTVKHPEHEETIEISKVKYEQDGKVKTAGLWITKDKEGKIVQKSALASMMRFYNAGKVSELVGKELDTTYDENNYLIIKAY